MTPYEFREHMRADMWRRDQDGRNLRYLAWLTAGLSRSKRLPAFKTFIDPLPIDHEAYVRTARENFNAMAKRIPHTVVRTG